MFLPMVSRMRSKVRVRVSNAGDTNRREVSQGPSLAASSGHALKADGILNESQVRPGEMAEWLKAHAWKACLPQGNVGSNPTLSAMQTFQSLLKKAAVNTAVAGSRRRQASPSQL